jgi:hypothetical protein
VTLASNGAKGSLSMDFNGAELPKKFDLVCDLTIFGVGVGVGTESGLFELDINPVFESFVISGVKALALTPEQIASLSADFPERTKEIGGNLGESFSAKVGEGKLMIDAAELFPPFDAARPDAESWDLVLDLSQLYVQQAPLANAPGLSLGGPGQPLRSGLNDLRGETLNHNAVKINGKVAVSIPDGTNKLTFRNFPGGIEKGPGRTYAKQVEVMMDVFLLDTVTVLAKDFGLDKVDQDIEQELGDDFADFKEWLNYIEFPKWTAEAPDYGLGVALEIEKLDIVGGLGLVINASDFGLHNVFQPLVNLKDPATGTDRENAVLLFMNKGSAGYQLKGDKLPEKLPITVKLGLEDPAAQQIYAATGILTMKDVVPGKAITVGGAKARLIFDWTKMSIKPKPHENGDDGDSLPTYPFTGTFPDEDDGIDLSNMPKGLGFYTPGGETGGKAGEGLAARLYISLKRQSLIDDEWVDDPSGDPASPDYDTNNPGGWGSNLQINLPNLDFRFKYGDDDLSDNLFTYEPDAAKGTDAWTLSRPLGKILADSEFVMEDTENADNPFMIYASSSLPEMEKAISLGNFAAALNEALSGKKKGPLFFKYEVDLNVPGEEEGTKEPGEILLYPDMLNKKIAVSVDLLLVVPLIFQAGSGVEKGAPVIVTIAPDLGDEDLFQRKGPDDNEYFDMVTSFGFDISAKNVAGISSGKLFLENKADVKKLKYRLPIVDFTGLSGNHLSLGSGELEKNKAIWPCIPPVSVEFESGDEVRIERNFNIELQSITVRAGGEYTFETGL